MRRRRTAANLLKDSPNRRTQRQSRCHTHQRRFTRHQEIPQQLSRRDVNFARTAAEFSPTATNCDTRQASSFLGPTAVKE
jgi:hypothetical protein